MSVIINGVTCEELVSRLEESSDQMGLHASKSYLCDWSNRYAVANGLLGLVSVIGGVGGSITIGNPDRYAESPNLFARSVSIEGVGKPSQGAFQVQYDKAIIHVSYGNFANGLDDPYRLHSIDPDRSYIFAEQELDIGGETITIPGNRLKFADDGSSLDQDYGIFVASVHMTITLHRVPYLDAQLVTSKAGKINDSEFLGCEVGHLRFNGAKTHRTHASDGTITQQYLFSFSYRPIAPWDYCLHKDGTWKQVVTRTGGTSLLTSTDLSEVIPAYYRY